MKWLYKAEKNLLRMHCFLGDVLYYRRRGYTLRKAIDLAGNTI